jgi:hypothetical protein
MDEVLNAVDEEMRDLSLDWSYRPLLA